MKKVKLTKDQVLEHLNNVADLKIWNPEGENIPMYASKIDGSYICFENLVMDTAWMFESGITEQIQSSLSDGTVANIGFNPLEQKWAGWSHRAVQQIGIGFKIKKGYPGYIPVDMDDFIEQMVEFWSNEAHINVSGIAATNDNGVLGAQITWEYDPKHVPNKSLHGTIGEQFCYPPKQWGRGEWTAKTLDDAKQMAIDFAESVS